MTFHIIFTDYLLMLDDVKFLFYCVTSSGIITVKKVQTVLLVISFTPRYSEENLRYLIKYNKMTISLKVDINELYCKTA